MAIYLDGKPADSAVRGIVVMNVVVALGAAVSGDGLMMLLWPYWLQSVVIGYYAMRRIQKLERFKTENFKINGEAVDATPATRRKVWTFFLLHYGFFHLVYFMFLGVFSGGRMLAEAPEATGVDPWAPFWIGATLVGFLISHGQSHREHVAADLKGTPNIGTRMFVPYIRIVPMHLTIIFGAMLGGTFGLLLFAGLKTAADVVMHKVEHRLLQGGTMLPQRG